MEVVDQLCEDFDRDSSQQQKLTRGVDPDEGNIMLMYVNDC